MATCLKIIFLQIGPTDTTNLELNLSPDFKRKYDEWQKMKQDSVTGHPSPQQQQQHQQQQQDHGIYILNRLGYYV
jgi:hypothetical protein